MKIKIDSIRLLDNWNSVKYIETVSIFIYENDLTYLA